MLSVMAQARLKEPVCAEQEQLSPLDPAGSFVLVHNEAQRVLESFCIRK